MIWDILGTTIEVTILAWFAMIALLILYKIMTGTIAISNVVRHAGEESFGFHRAQLLAVTLLFAAGYVIIALRQPAGLGMPDISTPMLAALLGSHAAYLGGKLLHQ
jgi:hypothetical protein